MNGGGKGRFFIGVCLLAFPIFFILGVVGFAFDAVWIPGIFLLVVLLVCGFVAAAPNSVVPKDEE